MFTMFRLTVLLTVLASSFVFADNRVRIKATEDGPMDALQKAGFSAWQLAGLYRTNGDPLAPCKYSTAGDREFVFDPATPQDKSKTWELLKQSQGCNGKPVSPATLVSTPKQQVATKPPVQAQPAKTEAQAKVQPSPVLTKSQLPTLPLTPKAKETALEKELSTYRARLNSADDTRVQMIKALKDDMERNYIRKDGVVPKEQYEREMAKASLIGISEGVSFGLTVPLVLYFVYGKLRGRGTKKRIRKVDYVLTKGSPTTGMPIKVGEVFLDGSLEPTNECLLVKSHHEITRLASLEYHENGYPKMLTRDLSAEEIAHFALHRKLKAWLENNPSLNSEVIDITEQKSPVKIRRSERRTDERTAIA